MTTKITSKGESLISIVVLYLCAPRRQKEIKTFKNTFAYSSFYYRFQHSYFQLYTFSVAEIR